MPRIPYCFPEVSAPSETLRGLRIWAALEDKSVPTLMRAIVAAYLRKLGRLGSA